MISSCWPRSAALTQALYEYEFGQVAYPCLDEIRPIAMIMFEDESCPFENESLNTMQIASGIIVNYGPLTAEQLLLPFTSLKRRPQRDKTEPQVSTPCLCLPLQEAPYTHL